MEPILTLVLGDLSEDVISDVGEVVGIGVGVGIEDGDDVGDVDGVRDGDEDRGGVDTIGFGSLSSFCKDFVEVFDIIGLNFCISSNFWFCRDELSLRIKKPAKVRMLNNRKNTKNQNTFFILHHQSE